MPSSISCGRRALEDHAPAVLARARTEIDDVVRGADRLLVVLDDDDGVAEIAQARQRRRAARGCRAGAGRSTARRARTARRSGSRRSASRGGCAGPRRPTASPRCVRASGSRRRRREEPQPLLDLPQDALGDDRFAVRQLERSNTSSASADRQVDVVGDRPPLHASRPGSRGFSRSPRHVGHGRSDRYGSSSACSSSCPPRSGGAGSGAMPSKSCPYGSPRAPSRGVRCGAHRLAAARPGPNSSRSRCFRGSFANGTSRSMPKFARERVERVAHELAIAARPRRDRAVEQRLRLVGHDAAADRSRTSRRGPGTRGRRRAAS